MLLKRTREGLLADIRSRMNANDYDANLERVRGILKRSDDPELRALLAEADANPPKRGRGRPKTARAAKRAHAGRPAKDAPATVVNLDLMPSMTIEQKKKWLARWLADGEVIERVQNYLSKGLRPAGAIALAAGDLALSPSEIRRAYYGEDR
jgi:uncharacterized protein YoaH (UPF0181 family)